MEGIFACFFDSQNIGQDASHNSLEFICFDQFESHIDDDHDDWYMDEDY